MLTKVILEKNDGKFIKCIEGKLGMHLGEYEWYLFIQSKDGIYRLRRIIVKYQKDTLLEVIGYLYGNNS